MVILIIFFNKPQPGSRKKSLNNFLKIIYNKALMVLENRHLLDLEKILFETSQQCSDDLWENIVKEILPTHAVALETIFFKNTHPGSNIPWKYT